MCNSFTDYALFRSKIAEGIAEEFHLFDCEYNIIS